MFPRELIPIDANESVGTLGITGPLAVEFSPDYPDPLSYLTTKEVMLVIVIFNLQ